MPLSGKGGLEKLNASIYDCERWEKTHRKRSLHPVSHLYLAGMGGSIAMPHSSLFITRILGKRNTGGIYHPSCAFHIPGLSLQMAQGGLDTTSHIVRSGVFTPRGMGVLQGLSQRLFQSYSVCEKQMSHKVSDFCYEAMISGSWYVSIHYLLYCCFLLWWMWLELWVALGGSFKWEAWHFAKSCIYSWLK